MSQVGGPTSGGGGGGAGVEEITLQTGTSPIAPIANNINFNGAVVAAGTNPVRTDGTASDTMALEVQISQAIAATDATKIGLSNFNSDQFSVDGNGFVSLKGGGQAIDSVAVQTGTSPIVPLANGLISISGSVVVAGTNPIRTDGTGASAMAVEVQISQAIASGDATKIGLSNFNSADFTTSVAGFVSAIGGGFVRTVGVDAATGPGTSPVVPTSGGLLTVTGGQIAPAGLANAIRTNSLAANTFTVQIQQSTTAAAPDTTKNGIASFNSNAFVADGTGFISLRGGGQAIEQITVQTGTTPVSPTSFGILTISGSLVAAGTNPIRTDGTGANTMAVEVQTSQALAAADSTKVGLSNFDSGSFAVAATGFVTLTGVTTDKWTDASGAFSPLKGNGYFITATATGTLPASPSQGDTIKFAVDHASQLLTIQATGTQVIRIGTAVSAAAGTAVSIARGDSVTLVYRSTGTAWIATSVLGTWSVV